MAAQKEFDNKYEFGEVVAISNLKKGIQFNGLLARIMKYNSEKQRYQISVITPDEEEHQILIKPDCVVCDKTSGLSQMGGCMHCRSVFYCSPSCQMQDTFTHASVCSSYREFAKMEYRVIKEMNELFQFDNLLIHYDESDRTPQHYFLRKMNLKDTGIWKRFCDCDRTKFGELNINETLSSDFNFGVISSEIHVPIIVNWSEYYKVKNLSLKSPIAHWMSWVMTTYHALTQYLNMKPNVGDIKEIVIHFVGVEVEIDLIYLFEELLYILPGYNFHFYLFGNDDRISNKYLKGDYCQTFKRKGNTECVHFSIFKDTYNENSINKWIKQKEHQLPRLVLGFNAGLSAGEYGNNWNDALSYIINNNLPALFTEYFNHSILMDQRKLKRFYGKELSRKYTINPFRSPIIDFMNRTRFSSITNGFICGINI
eukprot:1038783_1